MKRVVLSLNDNNREGKKKSVACFECEPRVPREKKALSSVFLFKEQCAEFASTMQWLEKMQGVSFHW